MKQKKPLYFRVLCAVTLAVVGVMLLYMLLTFFTHGDSSLSGTYNTAWLTANMTVDGGCFSETAPKGSLDAIRAAAELSYNVKLRACLKEDTLFLDYENGDTLANALAVTEENRAGVIVQLADEKAAEAFLTLLRTLDYQNGNVAVQSSDVACLAYFKENCPNMLRGLVTGALTDTSLNGFEKFLHRNLFRNFRCRPHYVVYDEAHLPCLAASAMRRQNVLVLAEVEKLPSDVSSLLSLEEETDGLIYNLPEELLSGAK